MTWAEFKADLSELLPIDAEREGAISYADRLTRAAVISLQGTIPRLQGPNVTTLSFLQTQTVGYASLGVTPSSGSIKIKEAWLVRTATGGTFVVGHTYRITSLGDTDWASIGASASAVGIIFTATAVGTGNGTAEECRLELRQIPWSLRFKMINGLMDGPPGLSLDPHGSQFYVSPTLVAGDEIEINWNGIRQTFQNADILPDNWDQQMVKAVFLYVKGHIARQIDNDIPAYNTYMRDFAIDRKALYAREKERELTAK